MFSRAVISLFGLWLGAVSAQVMQDPTRPASVAAQVSQHSVMSLDNVNLTAVFVSEQSALAVINGKSLRVGERLQGATLTEITADSVTLVLEQASHKIHLMKQVEEIKTDVSNQF